MFLSDGPRGHISGPWHGLFAASFPWDLVGLVISEDKKGVQFLSDLRGEMDENGICAAFVQMIPVTGSLYTSRNFQYHLRIKESSVKVVIVYCDVHSLISLSFSK